DGLGNIEAFHESPHTGDFTRGHSFHGKTKIMVCAIGHARAHALARSFPIVIDTDHARGHDVDFQDRSPCFFCAFGDASLRPLHDVEIEAGSKNHAVAHTTGDPERLRTFRGNVDGHRALANFQCNAAAGGAFPGFWNFDASVM